MRVARTPRLQRKSMTAPVASALRRNAPMVPKRPSVSMPSPVLRLQGINNQLREARTKKITAQCKSIAWDASRVAIILPTAAAYYFSGAGICVVLLGVPNLDPADCFDAQIPLLIMGAMHLASRKALSAEGKLCGFLDKKCAVHDEKITEAKNLIDELQKQRKALLKR